MLLISHFDIGIISGENFKFYSKFGLEIIDSVFYFGKFKYFYCISTRKVPVTYNNILRETGYTFSNKRGQCKFY